MLKQENDLSSARSLEHSSKQPKNKDLCDTSASESGYLSGPLSGPQSGYLSDPKALLSGDLDSGYLDSGLGAHSFQSDEKPQKAEIDTFLDSGVVIDTPSQMEIKSGPDADLSEYFEKFNLDESNDLDRTKKTTAPQPWQGTTPKSIDQFLKLVELYYQQDNDGDTQLHLAIINEIPIDIIGSIIRLAPEPWPLDLKNDDAQTPIHLAVITRQSNVVRRLLLAGAEASIRDGNGNTPLHLACIYEDLDSIDALLKQIATAELKEYRPITKQSPQSNALQRFSVDLKQRNFYGENCVHIATQRNQIQILEKLVHEGANINAREGRAGYTPLHIAVKARNVEMAKFLLENCKNLNTEAVTYGQITAYQMACQIDQPEMIETLERNGCEVISPPESDYEDSDGLDEFDSD